MTNPKLRLDATYYFTLSTRESADIIRYYRLFRKHGYSIGTCRRLLTKQGDRYSQRSFWAGRWVENYEAKQRAMARMLGE